MVRTTSRGSVSGTGREPGPIRVLFSCAGRRVGLIECFRRAGEALGRAVEVIATDVDPDLSTACHVADRAFAVPPCGDPAFVEMTLALCRDLGVELLVPTIDPELMPLARAAQRFRQVGTRVLVGHPEAIAVARDKGRTARVLADAGVPVPRTGDVADAIANPDEWDWPLIAKPAAGSASRGLVTAHFPDALPTGTREPYIVQTHLSGPEYTVNVFLQAGRPGGVGIVAVPHLRMSVRAGEVEKGRTERREDLIALARAVCAALPGLAAGAHGAAGAGRATPGSGVFCFQVIDDPAHGPRVFEINARFGGGYPLADRAGASFARWLLEETVDRRCRPRDDWREGVTMLRYDAALFEEGTPAQVAAPRRGARPPALAPAAGNGPARDEAALVGHG